MSLYQMLGPFNNLPRKITQVVSSHSAGKTEKDLQGNAQTSSVENTELPSSLTQFLLITSVRIITQSLKGKERHVKGGVRIPLEDGNTKWKKKGVQIEPKRFIHKILPGNIELSDKLSIHSR